MTDAEIGELLKRVAREMHAACDRIAEAAPVMIRYTLVAAAPVTDDMTVTCGGNGTAKLTTKMLIRALIINQKERTVCERCGARAGEPCDPVQHNAHREGV